MSIVITGASGKLGRRTAQYVLERTSDVILVTRHPEALADLGGDVRHGDFSDPASLEAAFAGGERMLLISTDVVGPGRVALHRNAIAAAARAGVRQIAYTSLVNPSDNNPAGVAPDHNQTEQAIRDSGVEWTFLRNAIYAEIMAAGAQPAIDAGKLVTNAGDGRSAYVLHDDCAAAAAAVLTTPGHEGKAYDITGPEALSVEDVAALYAEAGGKPVEPLKLDDDAWIEAMTGFGMPDAAARLYASFGRSTRQGYAAAVSTAVQDLTGRAPRPAREALLSLAAR
jgi:NAD(P)H dehydrogenase (quinone)